jgi:hypothetical protein
MIFQIEDLVANALIESIEERKERKITFQQLELFCNNMLTVLQKEGKNAIIPNSETNTKYFFYRFSDFFEQEGSGIKSCICLKKEKSADDLRKKFRSYLPLDLLIVFISNKLLQPMRGKS